MRSKDTAISEIFRVFSTELKRTRQNTNVRQTFGELINSDRFPDGLRIYFLYYPSIGRNRDPVLAHIGLAIRRSTDTSRRISSFRHYREEIRSLSCSDVEVRIGPVS